MINWDLYNSRLNVNGEDQRSRALHNQSELYRKKNEQSLSCKKVKINELETKLIIDSGTKDVFKSIKSMPSFQFYTGDIVEFANSNWLITEADSDSELYTDGKMTECNYKLRWQNENGEIVERWIVTQNASSYSNGTEGNKTIEIGADQLMLLIPLDAETVKLRRGKRFFIDSNTVEPMPYELTRPDSTTFVKNGYGYLCCIATESQTNTETDRVDLMICDYIEPFVAPAESVGVCEISCKYDTVKSGGSTRKYAAKFYDIAGNVVDGITPVWTIECDFMDSLNVNYGDELQISINDDSKIGETFIVKLSGEGYDEVKKIITVVSLY